MGYTVDQFINHIAPIIRAEATKRGYKICSTVIAQAIIEGRYGNSSLAAPPNHNHFGIKCGSTWLKEGKPAVNMKTKEEYKVGVLSTINDYFRRYPNGDEEGVAGYYDFVAAKRYANLKTATNYREYAQMLKADGYATSSTYVNTLCSTVEKYNLAQWDNASTVCPYTLNHTYTLCADMYVRLTPKGDKKPFADLSVNAQANGFADSEGFGILKKGAQVTCQGIEQVGTQTWMKIPSGWICCINEGNKIYVE